jgi:hypothetical protein
MLHRIVALGVCLTLTVAAAVSVTAGAGCKKCQVKGYVKAVNSHDLDRALGYFADEVKFSDADSELVLDRRALRGMIAWNVATNGSLSYSDLTWEGDVVEAVITEQNDFYQLLGIEALSYRAIFRFAGDQIRAVHFEPAAAADGSAVDALKPFLDWAAIRGGA